MKPDFGFGGECLVPGFPGIVGLRTPGNKAPVDGGDAVFLEDGEDAFKGTTSRPGHVFATDDGAVVFLQDLDPLASDFRAMIDMELNQVGVFKREFI